MPPVPEARLDTIRKLLAKAERAGTPDEAEIYTDKAVQMMARHGVDEAVLAATGGDRRADPIGRVRIPVDDPYSGAKARLLGWTAAALRCRWVMHDHRNGRVGAVTLFGHRSDTERAELLYTSLLLQISAQVAGVRPPHPGESVAAFRRSWIFGFASRIHQRLTEAEQAAVAEAEQAAVAEAGDRRGGAAGPSVELVLADRGDRVDRAYAEEFGALPRARRPQVSGSGHRHGAAAADRADLGGPAVTGRAPARITPR
ncbi:hypothetical protein AFB00_28220 [Pseudonocardia sp. HH130630-07]|nr:hypothetical protein AFB00_28220 [Pseudonocardia sp. HH130630-07]